MTHVVAWVSLVLLLCVGLITLISGAPEPAIGGAIGLAWIVLISATFDFIGEMQGKKQTPKPRKEPLDPPNYPF